MMSRAKHYLRAAGAIFRRDLRIFFRYPVDAIFWVFEPIMWLTPLHFMSRSFAVGGQNLGLAGYTGTSDYMAFLVLGGVIGSYVSSVMWSMGFSLKNEMDLGVLEVNWLTPVPVVIQLVGRSLFNLTHTTIKIACTMSLVWRIFGFSITGSIWPAFLTVLPMIIGLYGLGLGIAALVLISKNANNIIDMTHFMVNTLSGREFPITVLPKFLLGFSLAIPLTYGYDAIRGLLLGTRTLLPVATEQLLLVVVMAISVFGGYLVFRRIERRCRATGNLAHH